MPGLAFAQRVQDLLAATFHSWFALNTEDPKGRWTPEALAFRRLLRQQVPTTVWTGDFNGAPVVWVQRDTRTKRWRVEAAALPSDLADFLASYDTQGDLTKPFSDGPYLWVLRCGTSSPTTLLQRIQPLELFAQALRLDTEKAVRQWQNDLTAVYDRIGYQPLSLTFADPPPAPHPAMAMLSQDVQDILRPPTYAMLVEQVKACTPLACVPEEVAFVLERCLRLFLLGYQEWDLFTVSDHYAGLALEASLRWLYWRCFTYPTLLEWRDADGQVREWQRIREPRADWVGHRPVRYDVERGPWRLWVNGRPLDTRKRTLVDWAHEQQWLAPSEIRQTRILLQYRDVFSHPAGPHVRWYGSVEDHVTTAAALINAMWSRWADPDRVPWHGAFWSRPRWASRPHTPSRPDAQRPSARTSSRRVRLRDPAGQG